MKEETMTEHHLGTRDEWQAARDELAKLEAEHAELGRKVTEKRRELPWVPVEKEYEFDTEDGKRTLAELFDGRSQLLAYNIMYGPDYEVGACPGCTNVGDELDATRVHLNHRDVTLICFSRAPIDRLAAYRHRMGWTFPYVSTYATDFPFDLGLALTPQQSEQIPEIKEMIDNPPDWLEEWSRQVGAELKDGLREGPSFIAFARENGAVYHTYTVMAPDPFVAPYHSFLLERTPKPRGNGGLTWPHRGGLTWPHPVRPRADRSSFSEARVGGRRRDGIESGAVRADTPRPRPRGALDPGAGATPWRSPAHRPSGARLGAAA